MVRPASFRMNEETAVNNYYQKRGDDANPLILQQKALQEFAGLAALLKDHSIKVIIAEDTPEPQKPDSLFPNNWISFHKEGEDARIVLYPMFAENRRLERQAAIIDLVLAAGTAQWESLDLSDAESYGRYLEGTGSIVLDRENMIAYAALSPRTHEEVFLNWCKYMAYDAVIFHAWQSVNNERALIYHTNVMMCIGTSFCVICVDCIDDVTEKHNVVVALEKTGREIVYITEDQVKCFAGNMLEVRNASGAVFIVMSSSAFYALAENQKVRLAKYGKLIHTSLETIETYGGGSARCMMAEVFY